MSLRDRLNALPLFWKVYISIVAMQVFVVTLAEFILEPLTAKTLHGIIGEFKPWHEAIIWALSIFIPSLACGYFVSKVLFQKLDGMAEAAKALAHGRLKARLPTIGNDRDAFDLLAQNFNEMAGAIERQLYNERRLLADISHELRSPLTRMAVAAELLKQGRGTEENRALAQRLEKEVDQMSALVGQLLEQARDSLNTSGPDGPVDLSGLLADLAEDFAFQGRARNKAVLAQIRSGLTVYGNAPLLRRMFGNLISNALFYTPPYERVLLKAEADGKEVVVSIRDFGPGVPEEQLQDIFRAFYRVDSSRARASGGVGLGLALAREAALSHGGGIAAANAAPGLKLTVILPAHTAK